MSGFAESAAKYGSWFTWNGSPRALIFARNHSDVVDMTSMIDLMRLPHYMKYMYNFILSLKYAKRGKSLVYDV